MLDEILVARLHASAARSAAALLPISGNRRTLEIAAVADRDCDLLVGDQVFQVNFRGLVFDYGATLVTVKLLDFFQLSDDDLAQLFLGTENRFVFGDVLAGGAEF